MTQSQLFIWGLFLLPIIIAAILALALLAVSIAAVIGLIWRGIMSMIDYIEHLWQRCTRPGDSILRSSLV